MKLSDTRIAAEAGRQSTVPAVHAFVLVRLGEYFANPHAG